MLFETSLLDVTSISKDDAFAVSVDDVVLDRPVLRSAQLHTPIGVVIDVVVRDRRVVAADVDAVILIGGRQLSAAMDPAAVDRRVMGHAPARAVDQVEADRRVLIRHVDVRERHVIRADRRAGQPARVHAVQLQLREGDPVSARERHDAALDRRRVRRIGAGQHDRRSGLTAVRERDVGDEGRSGSQAAGLAGRERGGEVLHRRERRRRRAAVWRPSRWSGVEGTRRRGGGGRCCKREAGAQNGDCSEWRRQVRRDVTEGRGEVSYPRTRSAREAS